MPKRKLAIFLRWLDISVETILGSGVVLTLMWAEHVWDERTKYVTILQAPVWVHCTVALAFAVFLWHYGRSRWKAFFGIKHLWHYPSLSVSTTLGAVLVLYLLGRFPVLQTTLGVGVDVGVLGLLPWQLLILGSFVAADLVLAIEVWQLLRTPSPSLTSTVPMDPLISPEGLQKWISDDEAAKSSEADRFDHVRIARRMASRLLLADSPSQILIGPLGSGKTTIGNFVEEDLLVGSSTTRFVRIELWPYESPRAAVEGVLAETIEGIAKETNVLNLRGLPVAYGEAMVAANGVLGAVVRLQGVPSNPYELLQEIDKVVSTLGLRFVLWVENLERFVGDGNPESEKERLNPVRALLYGLDQLKSLVVVIATTKHRLRSDVGKIERYVEAIPELAEEHVGQIVHAFRDDCLKNSGIIDPASPEGRREFNRFQNMPGPRLTTFDRSRIDNARDAIVALCVTPRTLKNVLRVCRDIWERLRGEIDFDDLLALSAVRMSCPSVFAVIQDHLRYLRGSYSSENLERSSAEVRWGKALSAAINQDELDERSAAAVRKIVEFTFSPSRKKTNPQGVCNHAHADYWHRLEAVPELTDAERDQPILYAMSAYDTEAELLPILEDERRSQAMVDFESMLGLETVVKLFSLLVTRRARELPSEWPRDPMWTEFPRMPGLVSLWRIWLRRNESGELSHATVQREVRSAFDIVVPLNLAAAAAIEHFFVLPDLRERSSMWYQSDGFKDEMKMYLRRLLVETYKDKPIDLARALKGAAIPTLHWLVWGLDRIRQNEMKSIPFENWPTFSETVLEAVRRDPTTMLSQLSALVTDELTGRGMVEYRFNTERACLLFGSKEKVLELYKSIDSKELENDKRVQAVMAKVVGVAE